MNKSWGFNRIHFVADCFLLVFVGPEESQQRRGSVICFIYVNTIEATHVAAKLKTFGFYFDLALPEVKQRGWWVYRLDGI